MAVILNADNGVVSGISGLTTTADNSGVLQFQSSGTNTLTITTAGNVGIGTSSPSAYTNLTALTITGTNGAVLDLKAGNTLYGELYALVNELRVDATGASGVLKLMTNSAERMRITSAGNVGIGTSSPGSRLEVSGSAAQNLIVNSTSAASYMQFANSGGITGYIGSAGAINSTGGNNALGLRSQNEMAFATGGNTERMRIDSSGKVGIGTNSPSSYDSSSLMAVVSASNTSLTVASGATGLGQILFANGTGIPNIYNGLIRYDHNGNSMSFFTNGGNERMRIDSSGYVTMPFQPSFRAGLSSGAPSITSGAIWQFNNVSGSGRHNIGNHYNTSTYTFTAPVAGRYYFHMQVITESNTNNTARTDLIVFQINGSLSGYSERRAWYVLNSTGDSGYYTDNITAVFNLSAGDTVRGVNSSPTTATQHANVNYSIFEGYLIG